MLLECGLLCVCVLVEMTFESSSSACVYLYYKETHELTMPYFHSSMKVQGCFCEQSVPAALQFSLKECC